MRSLGRTAAIILATVLVPVTPVVAFADVGPKSELSITQDQLLTKVNTLMGDDSHAESNHGGIVSFVAQRDLEDLIKDLGLTGDKITRGQIIRVLAGSDTGKANKGKSKEAKANKGNSEEAAANTDDSDKDEKVVGQARADDNRAAAAATATARQDSEDDGDDEETGQGRGSENRQGANSHGNATRTTDGVTDAEDNEPGSQGRGRGNGNQNR